MPNATKPQNERTANRIHPAIAHPLTAIALFAAFALCLMIGVGMLGMNSSALADELKLETAAEPDSSEDSPEDPDGSGESSESSEPSQEGDSGEGENPTESSEASEPSESSSGKSSGSSPKEEYEEEDPEEEEGYGGLAVLVVDYDRDKLGMAESQFEASQGDASFEGIVFNVYGGGGDKVCQLVTAQDGYAALAEEDFLPLGSYLVKLDAASARDRGYEPNSEWVNKGVEAVIDEDDTYTDVGTCFCKVIRGEVQMNLVDGELFDTLGINDRAQGKARLDGAVFELYNGSALSVVVDGKEYEPYQGEGSVPIMELVTDESGLAYSDGGEKGEGLPWGTYIMKQKKASKGYKGPNEEGNDENGNYIDLESRLTGVAEVRGQDRYDTYDVMRAEAKHGGVKIAMVDAETADGSAQGDATLKGAVFEILSANGKDSTVIYDGAAYANGDVMLKVKTNAKGIAKTAAEELPFGTYKVRMCKDKSTRSYAYDDTWSAKIKVKKNGKRTNLGKSKACAAKAVRGGVTLKRLEKATKKPVSGGSFEVVNASKAAVVVGGKTYEPGKVVLKLKVASDGVAKSGKNELPYGTYTLRESEAGEGHELSRTWNSKVKVRKMGEVVDAGTVFDEALPEVEEEVEKKTDSSIPILPFVIILLVAAAGAAGIMMLLRKREAANVKAGFQKGAGRKPGSTSRGAHEKPASEDFQQADTVAMEAAAMGAAAAETAAVETVAMDTVAMETELLSAVEDVPRDQAAANSWAPTELIVDAADAAGADATVALDTATQTDVTQMLETAAEIDVPQVIDTAAGADVSHALDAIRAMNIEDATVSMGAVAKAEADTAAPNEGFEEALRALYAIGETDIAGAAGSADKPDDSGSLYEMTVGSLEDAIPPIDVQEEAGDENETTAELYSAAEVFPDADSNQTRSLDALDETIEFGAVKPLLPYDLSTGKQRKEPRNGFFKRGKK